jgi:uncharacterized protein (TIGR02001 family)
MLTSVRSLLAATVLAGSLFAATPAFADDGPLTVSGSAAIVSQYRFRGIAQSNNLPVVQGSITLSHESGFYVSTWGSSASPGPYVDIGGTEIDVYGGFTHDLGSSGVNIDVGVYGYLYPGATGGNYYELYGNLSTTVGPVNAKVGLYVAPSQGNVSTTNTYVFGELSGGIPGTPITLHGHLGHTGGAFDYPYDGVAKDYIDYSLGASVSWKALTLDVSWVGTGLSNSDYATSAVPLEAKRAAKSVGVVTLSASF